MTFNERKPWVTPTVVSRPSAISPEKRARIAELREEGLTMMVIAERLGLHLNTVHKWINRLGLIPRRPCGCATRGRPIAPECGCHVQVSAR